VLLLYFVVEVNIFGVTLTVAVSIKFSLISCSYLTYNCIHIEFDAMTTTDYST